MSTINAVQEQYASNEGLTMMHTDHSMPIGGAIVHFCQDQWFTSGTLNRCSGGRSHLNWAIISAMSTINAVQEQYARNEGLTMMHMDHAVRPSEVQPCTFVSTCGAPQELRTGARAGDFS